MARGPAGTVGALVNGALISVVAKTMAGVACLMITWMGGRKGNLRVSAGPPGLYSLEDAFFIGHQGRRRGRDVGRGGDAGGEGGDEGRRGVGGVAAGEF